MSGRRVVVVVEQVRYLEVVVEVDDLLDLDADELVVQHCPPASWEGEENRIVGIKEVDDE